MARVTPLLLLLGLVGCSTVPVEVDLLAGTQIPYGPAMGPDPVGTFRVRALPRISDNITGVVEYDHTSSLSTTKERYAINNVNVGVRITFK